MTPALGLFRLARSVLNLALLMVSSAGAENGAITPAAMTSWEIVCDPAATETERYAASEFQRLFLEMTGTTLPVVEMPTGGSGTVFIGPDAVVSSGSLPDRQVLGEEASRIRIEPKGVCIDGGRPRGTLYGVYEFFEELCGARFLTFNDTHFPKGASARSIPWGRRVVNPTFAFRWSYYGENSRYPEFAARLRVNTVSDDPKLGGRTGFRLVSHNVAYLVPSATFGKEHPESARRILAYFREALSLARSEAVRARVEKASLCAYRAALSASSMRWIYRDSVGYPDLEGFEPGLLDQYAALCARFDVTMDDERTSTETYFAAMRQLHAGLMAVGLENHVWRVMVLPERNGKVIEMTYRPTGRNVVHAPRAFNRFRHEEWVRQGDGPTAENIIAFAAEAEPQSVKLTLTTKDGSRLQRSISLVGDAVRFETTMTAGVPRTFEVLVHPEYDTATTSADPANLGIYVKQPDWTQVNRDWHEAIPTDRQRANVTDAVAGGAFAYYSRGANFGVEQRFDPQAFRALSLFWDASRQQINLELSSLVVTLEKGQQAGCAYEVRYLGDPPQLNH